MRRIVEYASDPNEERLPADLRDKRVVRLTLFSSTPDTFTLHFAVRGSGAKTASRYVHGQVRQAANGSLVQFALRSALNPRLAMVLMLSLVLMQDCYELVWGDFSTFNVVFTIVAPLAIGLLALLEKRMISRSFDAGITDALKQAISDRKPGALHG